MSIELTMPPLDCNYSFFSVVKYNHVNPVTPAITEAISTPVFAISKSSAECAKPNSAINIDMVKPMPPIKATPIICLKFKFFGRDVIPSLTATHVNPAIPISFPSTKPSVIPIDTGCVMIVSIEDHSIGMPAFANEKMGIII